MSRFEEATEKLKRYGLTIKRERRTFIIADPKSDDWVHLADINAVECFISGLNWHPEERRNW